MSNERWNDGYTIEALDRINSQMGFISDYLDGHPAIVKAEAGEHIDSALESLMAAYQLVGNLPDIEENRKNDLFSRVLELIAENNLEHWDETLVADIERGYSE